LQYCEPRPCDTKNDEHAVNRIPHSAYIPNVGNCYSTIHYSIGGFLLGDLDFTSNVTSIDEFNGKKYYVTKQSKMPRDIMDNIENTSRARNINNADIVITSKEIIVYKSYYVELFYSKSANKYLIFNGDYIKQCPITSFEFYKNAANKADYDGIVDNKTLLDVLMAKGVILESDYEPYYRGRMYAIHVSCPTELVDWMLSDKKKISDIDLTNLINSTNKNISFEEYKTLDSMLSSDDEATVSLGLNLLCSFNYTNNKVVIIYLLRNNRDNIMRKKLETSTRVKWLVKNVHENVLSWSSCNIYTCFGNMSDDEKETVRKIEIESMKKEAAKFFKELVDKQFSKDINYTFNIE
jgi:hypothetical protein